PGSLVVMISDFRFIDDAGRTQLVELARHNDVVMLHTYDTFERYLPKSGRYRVMNNQRSLEIDTANKAFRRNYQKRYLQHQAYLQRLSDELGVFLIDIATDDDMTAGLKDGLGLTRR
ncbi:MAG: hypothetical protein AAF353_10000, partial [Pseudomonadota bacterium]